MHYKLYKIGMLFGALILFSAGLNSAAAQTAITVTELIPLDFGIAIADTSRSTVTMDPDGSIVATGSTIITGATSPARWLITGDPNADIDVSFSSGDQFTGPGREMDLRRFRSEPRRNISLDSSGQLTLDVGARMVIRNNQVGGAYAATYTITVNYP